MHAQIGTAKQAIYRAGNHLGRIRRALYAADSTAAEAALVAITDLHGVIHQALDSIEAWYRDEKAEKPQQEPVQG